MKTGKYLLVGLGVLLALVTILFFNSQRVAAAQARTLWFPVKGTWYICQGYNTKELTHNNKAGYQLQYALDFSPDPTSAKGIYGCTYHANKPSAGDSAHKTVYAPADGTAIIYPSGESDLLYFKLNSGGCLQIGHLATRKTGKFKQGQSIGTLEGRLTHADGNMPHLHIAAFKDCPGSKNWTPVGFSSASNFQFYNAPDFVADGTVHKYYGTPVSQIIPPQPINLYGYCHDYKHYANVQGGNTVFDWKCVTSSGALMGIDMTDVCNWQYYGLLNIPRFASASSPYSWTCNQK